MVLKKSDGTKTFGVELNSIIAGVNQDGVYSGLAVSQRAAGANMSVDVASGTCYVGGTKYTEASTVNVAISAADPTNPRRDIITYDTSAGNPACIAGTPGANPNPPDIPDGDIVLAIVYVGVGVTAIYNTDITDAEVFVRLDKEIDDIDAHIESTTSVHGIADTSNLEHKTRYIKCDLVLQAHDGTVETNSTSYVKKKTITLNHLNPSPSTIRTYFYISWSGSSGTVYARIYKNGAPYGTERSVSTGTGFTEDLSFAQGDKLELWGKSSHSGTNCKLSNFRVLGKIEFNAFTATNS